jgi:large subunit ribosomal protein L31
MAKKATKSVSYHSQAVARCLNCKSEYTLGLTMDSISLEMCANCHPFYTGQETMLDTAGRIEKFQARLNKVAVKGKDTKKTKVRKLKAGLSDNLTIQPVN